MRNSRTGAKLLSRAATTAAARSSASTRLSSEQLESYDQNGFLTPLRVFTEAQARTLREHVERHEVLTGKTGNNCLYQGHIVHDWMYRAVTNPAILDAVADLIGPDILILSAQFWIKEQASESFVGWHQDHNYWGIEPFDLVTAWVALTDVTDHTRRQR